MHSPEAANHNATDTGYVSPPIRLDAGARIVERARCHRPACGQRHGEYMTIAFLASLARPSPTATAPSTSTGSLSRSTRGSTASPRDEIPR